MGTGNEEEEKYCDTCFWPSTSTSHIPSSVFTVSVAVRVHHPGSKSRLGFRRSSSVAEFVRQLQSAVDLIPSVVTQL